MARYESEGTWFSKEAQAERARWAQMMGRLNLVRPAAWHSFPHGDSTPRWPGPGEVIGHMYNRRTGSIDTLRAPDAPAPTTPPQLILGPVRRSARNPFAINPMNRYQAYSKAEWTRGDAWAHLRLQQIPGCPQRPTYRTDETGNAALVYSNDWRRSHTATEWRWYYCGFEYRDQP
jgi:hypothetical protein